MFKRVVAGVCLFLASLLAAAEELPDPMRPPDFEAAPDEADTTVSVRPELSLQSTLIAGGRRSAVINGRSVHVGSTIAGARVIHIAASRVRLRDAQGVITLRLASTGVKRRVDEEASR